MLSLERLSSKAAFLNGEDKRAGPVISEMAPAIAPE
ncbi:hypothetical protein JOD18_001546 [Gracilibacillus alcaliphilus]|nr:hypothetical protein [Gracilibacillus alcaliphilus]